MPFTRARVTAEDRVSRLYAVAERIARQQRPSDDDLREYARLAKDLSYDDYLQIEEVESRSLNDAVPAS